jgi:cytochrome c-type biogenesis protein
MGFSQDSSVQAMILASGYALGMGIPFLIIGLGVSRFTAWLKRFRKHMRSAQILSGVMLILIGIMLITNQLTMIAIWAQRHGFYANIVLGGGATPTYLIAVIAGLVSFLSPCVLPLVPAYIGYLSGHAVRES